MNYSCNSTAHITICSVFNGFFRRRYSDFFQSILSQSISAESVDLNVFTASYPDCIVPATSVRIDIPAIMSFIPSVAVIAVLPPEETTPTKEIIEMISPAVAVANPITADVLPVLSNSSVALVKPPNKDPITASLPASLRDLSVADVTTFAMGSESPAFFKITTVTITPVPTATFVKTDLRLILSPKSCAVWLLSAKSSIFSCGTYIYLQHITSVIVSSSSNNSVILFSAITISCK